MDRLAEDGEEGRNRPHFRRRALLGAAAWAWIGVRPAQAAATVRVSLVIDMREAIAAGRFDPARQRVGVRGGVAPLQWGRSLLAEPTGEPGRYRLAFEIARSATGGQPVAYKFKLELADAAQAAEATDPALVAWEEGRNRSFVLADGDALALQRAWGELTPPPPPRRTGRIDVHALAGPDGGAPRTVQVWLPPGWHAGGPSLPVLLLLDGDNQFDARAAAAEWQMDEHAQAGVVAGTLAPFIAVAVSQGGTRLHDYTPWPAADMPGAAGPAGGGLPAYADWLSGTVLPFVRGRYGARTGADHTAIGGASLGGLAAMWLLAERAQHFGAGLVVSPSVWWANRRLLDSVRTAPWAVPPRVWLCVGGREGAGTVADARHLRDTLAARDVRLRYVEDPDAGHDELAWARRVPAMLAFLHGR